MLSTDAGLVSQYIRANAGENLRLASPTGSMSLDGPQSTKISSFGGSIKMDARKDIHVGSVRTKKVVLQAGSLRMPNLTAVSDRTSSAHARGQQAQYQLCACKDGTLFIVPPAELCVADYHVCNA